MKKLQLSLILCLFFTAASAQIEVKTNPMFFLGFLGVSGEYSIHRNIGIELSANYAFFDRTRNVNLIGFYFKYKYKTKTSQIRLSTKFYIHPKHGNDRFYLSLFLAPRLTKYTMISSDYYPMQLASGYKKSGTIAGFLLGYKWAHNHRIILELGVGFGKLFGRKTTQNEEDVAPIQDFDFKFLGTIAVGYRFGKFSSKQKKELNRIQIEERRIPNNH